MTFAICIGITGVAGALISPVLAVQPFQGPPLTLKAFAITAMAGLGSVRGALGGAMVLGMVEAGLAIYIPRIGTNLAVVASFVLLVAAARAASPRPRQRAPTRGRHRDMNRRLFRAFPSRVDFAWPGRAT